MYRSAPVVACETYSKLGEDPGRRTVVLPVPEAGHAHRALTERGHEKGTMADAFVARDSDRAVERHRSRQLSRTWSRT